MTLSRVRVILYSLGLAILALWLTDQQDSKRQTDKNTTAPENSYSWQSSDSTTWKINRNEPNQQTTLYTETLRYQEATQLSEFTNPVITHSKADSLVMMTSQQGQTLNDESIRLSGDVIIKQTLIDDATAQAPRDNKTQNSTLSTDHITYNATNSELHTDAKVTITQPNNQTTAKGLSANLETGDYHFLSDVQGTYHLDSQNK
jgi:LPS export ABC transporter protein LptC